MRGRKLFAGARIRALRQSHDLTQAVFAERIGVSTSYLNQIENNQRPVTASVLLALADAFQFDLCFQHEYDDLHQCFHTLTCLKDAHSFYL